MGHPHNVVLVGMKRDLIQRNSTLREVYQHEALELAKKLTLAGVLETSAKDSNDLLISDPFLISTLHCYETTKDKLIPGAASSNNSDFLFNTARVGTGVFGNRAINQSEGSRFDRNSLYHHDDAFSGKIKSIQSDVSKSDQQSSESNNQPIVQKLQKIRRKKLAKKEKEKDGCC